MSVETKESWLGEAVKSFLIGLRATVSDGDCDRPIDAMLNFSTAAQPEIPSGLAHFELESDVECYSGARSYFVVVHGSVIAADASNIVRIWLDSAQAPASLNIVLAHAFSTAMRRAAAFELHSAALLEPRTQRAALLVGASGSGKSTLALHLTAMGWSHSTDDVVLLTRHKEKVEAHGLRAFFALTADTLAHSGIPQVAPLLANLPGPFFKTRLVAEKMFTSGFVSSCIPEVIFFASRTGKARSWVSELREAEAMQRLMRVCARACFDNPVSREYLRALETLSKQCRSFDLAGGTDLLNRPQYTASFLESVMAN